MLRWLGRPLVFLVLLLVSASGSGAGLGTRRVEGLDIPAGRPTSTLPYAAGNTWTVSCGYSCHPQNPYNQFAVDFLPTPSTDRTVYAPVSGHVTVEPTYHCWIHIDAGNGWVMNLMHLASTSVQNGVWVNAGDPIAVMGNQQGGTNGTCGYLSNPPPAAVLHMALWYQGTSYPFGAISCYTDSDLSWETPTNSKQLPNNCAPPPPPSMLGVLGTDGSVYVKQGGLGADWVFERGGAQAIALDGNHIVVLGDDGGISAKDGISGDWAILGGGAAQIAAGGNRVAIVAQDGGVRVKEGLYGDWVYVAGGAKAVALSGNRIAVLLQDGRLFAKDGIYGDWVFEGGGAQAIALDGNRIGVLRTDGGLIAKEGLSGEWVYLTGNVKATSFGGDLIAALYPDLSLSAKQSMYGDWTFLGGGICAVAVAGSRIVTVKNDLGVLAKEGIGGDWITETDGARQVAVAMNGTSSASDLSDIDCDNVPNDADNCPLIPNPGQENTDSACIPNGADIPGNCRANPDKDTLGDACDPDIDNDGLPNTSEGVFPIPGCPSATGPTDPLKKDTDGDGAIDGYECKMGTDPTNPADRPVCTSSIDTDGDGIPDCVEELGYGTSPTSKDTDGDSLGNDGCQDDKQIVDVNGDGQANVLDVFAVARIALVVGSYDPVSQAVADINKDGANNILDVVVAAKKSTLVEPHDVCR